ncbi:sigma-70 family RNA polymerase sigma factor [Tsuneonella sp. SYSU-LHT278]|uniref:sigma-70 family RNA polymerase sigma factor n=1 Tax=Tsuneonella sediminis TaxID=3416089 RepID=UPI003F7AF2BA
MTLRPDRLDTLAAAAFVGDRKAYRAFLEEAAIRLRIYVRRRMGLQTDVEDVVQECLIALHEKGGTFDPGRPVAPWMFAIARYKMADHWRREGRRPQMTSELPEVPVQPDDFASHDVATLLAQLPETQAEAVKLTRLEGMTNREASQAAGIRLSAMKLRVHRGIIALTRMVARSE